MKRNNIINFLKATLCAALMLVPFAMQSCTEDNTTLETVMLKLDVSEVSFTSESKSESFTVTGECNTTWKVDFQGSDATWLDIATTTGKGDIEFTISTNEKYTDANQERSCILVVTADGAKVLITIYQAGIIGAGSIEVTEFKDIDKSGGEVIVEVESNTTWRAVGCEGVTVISDDGTEYESLEYAVSDNDQKVTFVVAQNDNEDGSDKDYIVTIESDYFETIEISINQEGYLSSALSLYDSADMSGVEFDGVDEFGIDVYGDCTNISNEVIYIKVDEDSDWWVETSGNDPEWFTITEYKAEKSTEDDEDIEITELEDYFTIEVTESYCDSAPRLGTITVVSSNGVRKDVTIDLTLYQSNTVVTLDVVADAITFDSEGVMTSPAAPFTMSSNNATEWIVSEITYTDGIDEDWLELSFAEDFEYAANTAFELAITAATNIYLEDRTAEFTITALEGLEATADNTKIITITQTASAPKVWITDSEGVAISEIMIMGDAESTKTFNVVSNKAWSATVTDDERFSITPTSGVAFSEVEVTLKTLLANEEKDSKYGTVTFAMEDESTTTELSINQIKAVVMDFVTTADDLAAVSYYSGTFDIEVTTNSDWIIEFRDDADDTYSTDLITWLSIDNNLFTENETSATINVEWNQTGADRSAWILLIEPVSGEIMDSVEVTQGSYTASTMAASLLLFLRDLNDTDDNGVEDDDDPITPENWGAELPISEWEGITTASEYVAGDPTFYYITQEEIDAIEDPANTIIAFELPAKGFKGHLPSGNDTSVGLGMISTTANLPYFTNEIRVFDLSDNGELHGTISNNYVFPNLIRADFSDNKLEIVNASFFSTATKLQYVDLSNNLFQLNTTTTTVSTSVATTMNTHADLIYVDLSNAQFGGAIPTLAAATKLEYFDVSNNSFTGTISDAMSLCSSLRVLKCNNNSLNGTISADLQTNLMANFAMGSDAVSEPPIQMSGNASLNGTISATFQYWLMNLSEVDGATSLGHTLYSYTSDEVTSAIQTGTSLTLSARIPTNSVTVKITSDDDAFSAVSYYTSTIELGVEASVAWKIEFREDDGTTYTDNTINWLSTTSNTFDASATSATIDVEWNQTGVARSAWIVVYDTDQNAIMASAKVTQGIYSASTLAAQLLLFLQDLNDTNSNGEADDEAITPTNWGAELPISEWEGITTASEYVAGDAAFYYITQEEIDAITDKENTIIALELAGKGFSGHTPSGNNTSVGANLISNATYQPYFRDQVRVIDLSDNGELYGTLANYYTFGNLKIADFSNNKITIMNSLFLTGSPNMEYFDISNNSITGTGIANTTLSSLTKMVHFDVSANGYSGIMPNLANCTNLEYYNVSNNAMTGTLTEAMASLTKLTLFKCDNNALNETLTEVAQRNLMDNFVMMGDNAVEFPIQMSNNAPHMGELTLDFQYWLKGLDTDGVTSLGHKYTYTDADIATYITDGSKLTLYDPNPATVILFTDATDALFGSNVSAQTSDYTLTIDASDAWQIEFREDDLDTYSDTEATWITTPTTSYDATSTSATITIEWNTNTDATSRIGHILLLDADDNVMDSIKVTQNPYTALEAKMLAMFEIMRGTKELSLTNWGDPTIGIGAWQGITTAAEYTGEDTAIKELSDQNTIIELDLSGLGLNGALPVSVSDETQPIATAAALAITALKPQLRVLDLSDNELTGIFASWYLFPSMEYIDLSNNKLSTLNASCLPAMTNVTYVDLSNNSFGTSTSLSTSSSSTESTSLDYLTKIEYFDISNGGFAGGTATWLTLPLCTKLKHFDISNNAFKFAAPDLSHATELAYYDISNNSLTGTLADGMTTLPIKTLKCSNNAMTGVLHADFVLNENYTEWDAIENIFRQTADANDDLYSYPAQAALYLDGLGAMRAFYKQADGENWDWSAYSTTIESIDWLAYGYTIPTDLGAIANYVAMSTSAAGNVLWIGGNITNTACGNKLTRVKGEFPTELGMLTTAEYIQLAECSELTGSIPTYLYTRMRRLNIKNCGISQDIADVYTTLRTTDAATNLATESIISGNDFTGTFTADLQQNLITNFSTSTSTFDTKAIQMADNPNLEGELSVDFVNWLKNIDSNGDSLGHSWTYTDQEIYDYILSGTNMTVATESSYDSANVTTTTE